MAVQRMDNVGIVVEDLPATMAFLRELGLELEGQATVEAAWTLVLAGPVGGYERQLSGSLAGSLTDLG
jgi:hypothetical protein